MQTEGFRTTGRVWLLSALALAWVNACVPDEDHAQNKEMLDGQTHWLGSCDEDAECGAELQCVCGRCLALCSQSAACTVSGRDTNCVEPGSAALEALCSEPPPQAICLEICSDGSGCDSGQTCVAGHCIPNSSGSGTTRDGGHDTTGVASDAEVTTVPESSVPDAAPPHGSAEVDAGDAQSSASSNVSEPPADAGPTNSTDPPADDPECPTLDEDPCNSTPLCSAIYGQEPDGSSAFAGCESSTLPVATVEPYCAAAIYGRYLSFTTARLPEGWVISDGDECSLECFSPWKNPERAGEAGLSGCPCTSAGSVCVADVGLTCDDPTSSGGYAPSWLVSDACEKAPDCSGAWRLQECVDTFQYCAPSGGVVLDEGTLLYCGTEALECGLAATCDSERCKVLIGTTATGLSEDICVDYFHCDLLDLAPRCIQRAYPPFRPEDNVPLLLETCRAPTGWLEVDLSLCARAPQETAEECATRDEASCIDDCFPYVGRRSPDGAGEFISCGNEECSASRTVCAENADGDLVEFFGCAPTSYTEVDFSRCAP